MPPCNPSSNKSQFQLKRKLFSNMAYDPADLRIPGWLLRLLDLLIRLRIPLGRRWQLSLTRPGVLMLGAVLGIWAAALYSGNNLLYLCGGILIGIVVMALVQAATLLKSIPELSTHLPAWLESNLPFVLHQSLSLNTSTMPATFFPTPSFSASVDIQWQHWNSPLSLQTSEILHRKAQTMLLRGRLLGDQRQHLQLSQQSLSTSAPLGLFRLFHSRPDNTAISIMPAPIPWPAGIHASGSNQTGILQGDEYNDLRTYAPGDSPARIHWRKAANSQQEWRVKQFRQPAQQTEEHHLVVDLRLPSQQYQQAFERLLGMAWWWLHRQMESGQLITITIGQQQIHCTNPDTFLQAIQALAAARPESSPPKSQGDHLLSLFGAQI